MTECEFTCTPYIEKTNHKVVCQNGEFKPDIIYKTVKTLKLSSREATTVSPGV